jgi:TolB-like protein/Tfp pilus assembly protein PilF
LRTTFVPTTGISLLRHPFFDPDGIAPLKEVSGIFRRDPPTILATAEYRFFQTATSRKIFEMTPVKGGIAPEATAIRPALARLLESPQFAGAVRASRFIRFIVEMTLEGRGEMLRESVLGEEVFDRGTSFDPLVDTIVRVEAVKLRKRLRAYYRGSGRVEQVVIDIPKGAYQAVFRRRVRRRVRADRAMSIAVLPFANLSPSHAEEFWGDGLADELTSILSRARSLRVISRTSAFAFRGNPMDIRRIGERLGASVVVEGSVRRQQNRVRVAAQLTEVKSGLQLWSGTFERVVEDAWAVPQDVANAIVDAVRVELSIEDRRRMGKRHTANPEALELYLKACHVLDRFDAASQRESLQLFGRALEIDPHYPLPLVGIARARINLAMIGAAPPIEILPQAKEALQRALAIDPELAEAHSLAASLISRYEWGWAEAEQHYRAALRFAPNAADVHDDYASGFLAPLGRTEEALAENRVARELEPYSPRLERSHAFILLLARRLPDAEHASRQILQKNPDDGYTRLMLALALHGQKRIVEALAEYEHLYSTHPSIPHEGYVADVRALCGDRRPDQELLSRLSERARTEYVPAMVFVWLHLHLGQMEEALTAIEEAYRNREYELLVAKAGYGFDNFREYPRFQTIVAKLGLP